MPKELDAHKIDKLKKKVTIVGALVNLFLAVIKIAFGVLGQSAALIADGFHSLSDLISDFFVLIAIKLGSREADHDHPYGHRRFETMATAILSITLLAVAAGIAWDALERVIHPDKLLAPSQDTLGIAAISILANEWLYQYTNRIAKLTRSKLLYANAWHHRSDALSSIIVLIGIGAVFYGYKYADAIAAIIVALMIVKIGFSLLLGSLKELVDTSLPAKIVKEIRHTILAIDGVKDIHVLRTRQMGEDAFVDTHIVVDPRITVSEGHMIGDQVRDILIKDFDDILDVLVHIDPEDDEYNDLADTPPTRQQVGLLLQRYLSGFDTVIRHFNIHYLDGCIELEIILDYKNTNASPETIAQIKKLGKLMQQEQTTIANVSFFIRT